MAVIWRIQNAAFWVCALIRLNTVFIFILFLYGAMVYLFVCVEVLRPSQPNGVMSSVVCFPNHTFTGLSPLGG